MREEGLLITGAKDEDVLLDTTLRPQTLDDFVGQPKLKERLGISIDATTQLDQPLDHLLLSGPPGLGKTTIAGSCRVRWGRSCERLLALRSNVLATWPPCSRIST